MSDTEIEYSIDDASMTDDEIMGYMKRIGIGSPIKADLNSLAPLQIAHLTHIPYENYDSLEHKLTSLNHKELYRKLITEHRGGICFELNGLYAWLLKSIGFDVRSHLSRYIIPEGEIHQRTHRVMTVTIAGKRYLTDL